MNTTEVETDWNALLREALALEAQGQYSASILRYEKLLLQFPVHTVLYRNYGHVLYKAGHLSQCLTAYDKSLALDDHQPELYVTKGAVLNSLGQLTDAIACYDKAIQLKSDYPEAYFYRGNVFKQLEQYTAAITDYEQAIALNPDYLQAHHHLGIVLVALKRYSESLTHYDRVISLQPDYAPAYYNRANALSALGCYEDAVKYYQRAIELKPDYWEANNNLGNTLKKFNQYEAAVASYKRTLELKPDHALAHNNLADLLFLLKQYSNAVTHYDNAIKLMPDYVEAHYNRGQVLKELNRLEEALNSFDQAIALNKADNLFYEGVRQDLKLTLCNWDHYQQEILKNIVRIDQNENVSTPFTALLFTNSPAIELKCAQIWLRHKSIKESTLPLLPHYQRHKKIRVGYFSADFHDHPVMHLMAEVFEQHDTNHFECFAFSFNGYVDAWTDRASKSFEHFIHVQTLSDRAIAELARSYEIDIAVDLLGFTAGSRPNVFAERCAPVQISYLGYPGTTGASFMDYIIADKIVIPEEARGSYSEKIVYMPNSYMANYPLRNNLNLKGSRVDLGLPVDGFVFASFIKSNRITPTVFESWMNILRTIQGSVLWLREANDSAINNLRNMASQQGVNADRILFAKHVSIGQHLERLSFVDLFLDTFPFNAHSTASDVLRMGVPLITRMGESFVSRVGASLLSALEMPELITTSIEEYESMAITLALQPTQLAKIKNKLKQKIGSTSLFNSQEFTRDLESAYQLVYERYQKGLAPDHIYDLMDNQTVFL